MRAKRNGGDCPEPSQRAPESIQALLAFAENVKTCRHVSICTSLPMMDPREIRLTRVGVGRYFGEEALPTDAKLYCDRMCDVCTSPLLPFLIWTDAYGQVEILTAREPVEMQDCTLSVSRLLKLSSMRRRSTSSLILMSTMRSLRRGSRGERRVRKSRRVRRRRTGRW
jgi:hypothetical protein